MNEREEEPERGGACEGEREKKRRCSRTITTCGAIRHLPVRRLYHTRFHCTAVSSPVALLPPFFSICVVSCVISSCPCLPRHQSTMRVTSSTTPVPPLLTSSHVTQCPSWLEAQGFTFHGTLTLALTRSITHMLMLTLTLTLTHTHTVSVSTLYALACCCCCCSRPLLVTLGPSLRPHLPPSLPPPSSLRNSTD